MTTAVVFIVLVCARLLCPYCCFVFIIFWCRTWPSSSSRAWAKRGYSYLHVFIIMPHMAICFTCLLVWFFILLPHMASCACLYVSSLFGRTWLLASCACLYVSSLFGRTWLFASCACLYASSFLHSLAAHGYLLHVLASIVLRSLFFCRTWLFASCACSV